MVHAAILDSAERNRIMSMPLTKDERRALRYLASGKSIEEVAAILNWPVQAMRWTCAHPLVTWVLDELEARTSPSGSPWARREISQGRDMVDYFLVHARRWVGRAAGGWSQGEPSALRNISTSTARSSSQSIRDRRRAARR